MALSQCDAFKQELAGQDPAYDLLETRLADVLTQLSDYSAARNNLERISHGGCGRGGGWGR